MEESPELNSSTGEAQISTDDGFELKRLSKLLEESRQEAYELRARVQIAERCTLDLEGELEAYQQEVSEKEKFHEATLREVQEEKLLLLKEAEGKIVNLEGEYQILSNKYTELEKELQAKADKDKLLKLHQNEQDLLQQELKEALDSLTATNEACKQHKELILVLQNEKHILSERVVTLENSLELYKEHLCVSKAQHLDLTEQLQEAQEQLALTQNELTALKSAPADVKARGNSLFAEVEDDRQKILKQYRLVLAKYNHVKGDYSSKCAEITRLKKEMAKLIVRLDTVEKEAKKHYKSYVANYEIRIQDLQMTINDLKNDAKPVYLSGDREILKFAEKTVENSRKEVFRLREEMEWRSALRLNEAAELLKTRGELAEVRSEFRQANLKIKKLKELLELHGVADTTHVDSDEVPVKEKKSPKPNISDLIDTIMVPWKQADQRRSEETSKSPSVGEEVCKTTPRPEGRNDSGEERPVVDKQNSLVVIPSIDTACESIRSLSENLDKEMSTTVACSNKTPSTIMEEELTLHGALGRNERCIGHGEELEPEIELTRDNQCGTAKEGSIGLTIPVEDEPKITPEEELALQTVREENQQVIVGEELTLQVSLDEKEQQLTLEHDENFALQDELELEAVRDESSQSVSMEASMRPEAGEPASLRKHLPLQAESEQFTSLEEELALFSGFHGIKQEHDSSLSIHEDELHLINSSTQNTPKMRRSEVVLHLPVRSPTTREELPLDSEKFFTREADAKSKTDFTDDSRYVVEGNVKIKQEPADEVSPSSEWNSTGLSRSNRIFSSVAFSVPCSETDALKREEVSPSTPVKAYGSSLSDTPASILKNRNRDFTDRECSSKTVQFDNNVKSESDIVKTEKENAIGDGSEKSSNEAKPKRKFKRPPPKKAYPIYYVTS